MAGEETTQIEIIEGRAARPKTNRVKYPAEEGVFGSPTLINNVETFLCIPFILKHGHAKWTAIQGSDKAQCGLKLYNIVGDVERNVVIEAPVGETLGRILAEAKVEVASIAHAEVGGEGQ